MASLTAFSLAVVLSASVGGASPGRAAASGARPAAGEAMAGMPMTSPQGAGQDYWSSVAGQPFRSSGGPAPTTSAPTRSSGTTRPTGTNEITGKPFDDVADTYVQDTVRAGSARRYEKCLYRGYTDATFAAPEGAGGRGSLPRPPRPGASAPRSATRSRSSSATPARSRRASTRTASSTPRAARARPTTTAPRGAEKADDAVPPGGTHTYTWEVPERAGPGPRRRLLGDVDVPLAHRRGRPTPTPA